LTILQKPSQFFLFQFPTLVLLRGIFVTRYNILLPALAVLFSLILSGCNLFSYEFKGTQFDPPIPIDDFELVDNHNQPFHLSDVKGNIVLVFFGYTFCPDVCPLTLADVRTALDGLEGREHVKVLFISVDPDRDTPESLDEYVTAFDPDFIGLTDPDYANVQKVMKPFGAYAEKEGVENSAAGYLVNHTARLYLLNPQQEMLLTYAFGFDADDLRSDLEHLISQLGS